MHVSGYTTYVHSYCVCVLIDMGYTSEQLLFNDPGSTTIAIHSFGLSFSYQPKRHHIVIGSQIKIKM